MEGKITLEFNCPEQEREAKMAIDGSSWYLVFIEFRQAIRQKCKHAEEEVLFSEEDIYKILNDARERCDLPFEY